MHLDHWQYLGVAWKNNILQVIMNTGERYQFFGVPPWQAVLFVRKPDEELSKGWRFERVRGRSSLSISLRERKDTIEHYARQTRSGTDLVGSPV